MSILISSPIPLKELPISFNPPLTFPDNILTKPPPNFEILSTITLIAAPIPAKATDNNSAPFFVLAKKVAIELKAKRNKPTPVDAIPILTDLNKNLAPFAAAAHPAFNPFIEIPRICISAITSLPSSFTSSIFCLVSLSSLFHFFWSLATSPIFVSILNTISSLSAISLFFKVLLLFLFV